MSTDKRSLAASLLVFVLGVVPCAALESPNLGRVATDDEMVAWDISIWPDGAGLPPGSGTAKHGQAIYNTQCMTCHGDKGVGQPNDRLVGGQGTLVGDQVPIKTVGSYWPYATTLFDYVRRAMPWTATRSLTDEEVYAITAYILHLNGIIGEGDVINAQTLPAVKMPNRDNFIMVYPREP
jgi:mono/diheme cytochrome c family protein